MTNYTFTPEELKLVLEALAYRASRRKSEARFYPNRRKFYRDCEEQLRALHNKLTVYRGAE